MTQETTPYEVTYNLFRRRGSSRLHCAVPLDWHIPAFVNDRAWDFVGALSEHAVLGAVGIRSGLLAVPVASRNYQSLCLSPLRGG